MTMLTRSLVTLAAVLVFASPALAGPPLICHPFEIESGKLIAWGQGSGWNTPDRSYDIKRLVADTNAILTPDSPILTRMENMRRATIYAMRDPVIAQELLKTVMARALATTSDGRAWFDAGYLIESYKQAESLRVDTKPELRAWAAVDETIKVDGYNWVKKVDGDERAERGDGIRGLADDPGLAGERPSRQGRCGRREGHGPRPQPRGARVLRKEIGIRK